MGETSYETIEQIIRNGMLEDLPLSLFGASTDEDDAPQENNQCMKVFTSLSKLYAHLRIHTKEKPFVCPHPGCEMTFNQKGNLKQHFALAHSSTTDSDGSGSGITENE